MLITALVQPVVKVRGVLPDVVTLMLGLPGLPNVKTVVPTELTRTLLTITGRGKVIVPCGPALVM